MRVGWSPPKDRPSRQAGTDLEQLDFHKVVIVAGELAHRDEAIGLEVHALAPAATRPAGLFAAVRHRADRKRWVDQLHLTRRWSVLRCLWSALSRTEFAATWCSSRCNDKIDGRHERFFVLTPSPRPSPAESSCLQHLLSVRSEISSDFPSLLCSRKEEER